jgi:TPR repeat protein|eukprot:COSAG03_NODE_148_length_11571_cov_9.471583_8_plen_344_part_00
MAPSAASSSGDELTDDGSCGASWLVARESAPESSGSESSSGSSSEEDDDSSPDELCASAAMRAASAARQRAQAGSAAAQFDIAKRYLDGNGVVSDDAEAVRWLRRAATQGHVGAQHRLALCLAEGRGAPRDTSDAVQWLRRAANKGHAPSAAELLKREQQLSGFLHSNVVVVAGRTARPAAELQQAAVDSLAGCTLELELRQRGGWVSMSGVVASAPAERAGSESKRGKLLLLLPRSSAEPERLWSTVVTDRQIRRYHVTAGPPASSAAAAGRSGREGSALSESERAAVEWRRSSSRIPDVRGEAWCETWDSLGRSLGRDPANLAAAYAQHTALNPQLCEGAR